MSLCKFCTGAIPSPHHTAQCLSKPIEEWIAIANGLQEQVHGNRNYYCTQHDKIVFWQGKYTMVKNENNILRKRTGLQVWYAGLTRQVREEKFGDTIPRSYCDRCNYFMMDDSIITKEKHYRGKCLKI